MSTTFFTRTSMEPLSILHILRNLVHTKSFEDFKDRSYSDYIHTLIIKKEQRLVCTEKFTWVLEDGKRVLRKMFGDTLKIFYIKDKLACAVLRAEIENAAHIVITELVDSTVIWSYENVVENWERLSLVSSWLGLNCSLLDRDMADGIPTDEILLQEFAQQLIYPFLEIFLLSCRSEDFRLWIRFLNKPFFHWNGRFTKEVQPRLMPVLEKLLTTLQNSSSIYQTHKDYCFWLDISKLVRSEKVQSQIMDRVLHNIWDNVFQDIFSEKLSRYPSFHDDKEIMYALLEIVPANLKDKFTKLLEEIILKKQKSEAFIEQIVNNHYVYGKDIRTPILCDSIKHAHMSLFADKKVFDDYIIYLDKTLRDSKTSVGEKIRLLYTAVGLILYIKDKDIFLASYQKKMAQRLLSSVESEAESFLIEYLKTQIGMSAVYRIETMYKDSIKPVTNMFINHTLRTLNYASWSENIMSIPDWKIPVALAPIADIFLSKENASKKLTWLPAHDTLTLQTTFAGKPYTLVMTSIQASVLMLFDDGVQLLEADIQEKTGIPTYAMKSVLHSIVSSRVPLLAVSEGIYKLVEKPRTNLLCIKLPRPQVVQAPDRRVVADVQVEREYSTDSAIVRIMKSRKRAAYTEIQMEVVRQLSHLFVPDVPFIKGRIENLIDRDYIERDDDVSYLLYVA